MNPTHDENELNKKERDSTCLWREKVSKHNYCYVELLQKIEFATVGEDNEFVFVLNDKLIPDQGLYA